MNQFTLPFVPPPEMTTGKQNFGHPVSFKLNINLTTSLVKGINFHKKTKIQSIESMIFKRKRPVGRATIF